MANLGFRSVLAMLGSLIGLGGKEARSYGAPPLLAKPSSKPKKLTFRQKLARHYHKIAEHHAALNAKVRTRQVVRRAMFAWAFRATSKEFDGEPRAIRRAAAKEKMLLMWISRPRVAA